jgi:integrase
MSKSTLRKPRRKATAKPAKPYPLFPLTPHAGGKWMKKVRGKIHYFGRWANVVDGRLERIDGDGWKEALDDYKAQADDLHAGRTPRAKPDGLTVADLCNRFLTAKLRKRDAEELSPRTFSEYKEVTDLLVEKFGKTRLVDDLAAEDFATLRAGLAKKWGPVRLANTITRIRTVFKYGVDNGLIERAVRYGTEFTKPDRATMRRHRTKAGPKMLEAEQLRRLLDALEGKKVAIGQTPDAEAKVKLEGSPQFRAMVLLGLNCGYGNTDIATLPLGAIDIKRGWVDFPRPKTGIARRCPLWPETIDALRVVLDSRPTPQTDAEKNIVFLNSRGTQWVRLTPSSRSDSLSRIFRETLLALGIHRDGIGFYTLRHIFRTIANGTRDPVAIDLIMGHADHTMGERYRERIDDARLEAVVKVVRDWLFAEPKASK